MRIAGNELTGELLDRRYRIDTPIARGGMSTVYRGIDTRLDRPVAIKIMDPSFAADPQFLARFEFEARAVARLKHPGLVAVYDQGTEDNLAFLVMELVEGGTLRELLRERGPMPPHAARAVAEPVLDALGVAHAAGLVHRDIKPENVLISDSGEVKIADFGLVRAVAASSTTSSSVILGTAAYLSPEQVATGSADARSDVYAVGVLMFEMLTGSTPFTGDTALSVAYQRLNNDVAPPSTVIPGVPAEFDDLICAATAREAAHRFVDARAMAAELRAVASVLSLPPYRVPSPQRSAEHLSAQYRRPANPPTQQFPPPPVPAPPIADAATVQHAAVAAPRQHTRVVTAPNPRDDRPHPPAEFAPEPPIHAWADDRRRSRRTMLIWLLVVLLMAVAVGVGGWWLGSGRYTAIPPVDGMNAASATAALTEAGLTASVRRQYSDTAPVESVLGTDPVGGSRVTRNSAVAVLVSAGRPSVPQLGPSDDVATVRAKLADVTLQPVDGGEAFSTSAPLGTVAALNPAPGTVVGVGTPVQVVRSKGAPPVQLPDLKGRSAAEATAALSALGIGVSETADVFDQGVAGGRVVGTDPKPGTTVAAGGQVRLLVSNAVQVPTLVGHSVGSARDQLDGLGLRAQVRQMGNSDRSLVITQNPGSGSLVQPGTRITLFSLP